MKNYPTARTCPSCFSAQYVEFGTDPLTGNWEYHCDDPRHGENQYEWSVIPPTPLEYIQPRDGYLAELGVYDDLLTCIHSDDGWLEYGVVEERYRRCAPATYDRLVREFSHSARNAIRGGPDVNPDRGRKVSSRIAGALSNLAREGLIARSNGPATGYWDYLNPSVTYWGPLPEPDKDNVTSWSTYAAANGLPPTEWILSES